MKKGIYLVIVQTEEIMNSHLDELEKGNRNCERKILNFDHDDDEEED